MRDLSQGLREPPLALASKLVHGPSEGNELGFHQLNESGQPCIDDRYRRLAVGKLLKERNRIIVCLEPRLHGQQLAIVFGDDEFSEVGEPEFQRLLRKRRWIGFGNQRSRLNGHPSLPRPLCWRGSRHCLPRSWRLTASCAAQEPRR